MRSTITIYRCLKHLDSQAFAFVTYTSMIPFDVLNHILLINIKYCAHISSLIEITIECKYKKNWTSSKFCLSNLVFAYV